MFDDRHSFTKIRKNKEAASSSERVMQQLASSRNRRLAQLMERRPSVAAALRKVSIFWRLVFERCQRAGALINASFVQDSIKSRLGLPGAISVRDRLRYPRGFGARRGRGALSGKSPLTRALSRGENLDGVIWMLNSKIFTIFKLPKPALPKCCYF